MSDYPDNILWRAVLIAFAQLAVVAAVFVAVYYATRITPEREAELKAQGAAAFDSKVERSGGWDAWLAGELNSVASAPSPTHSPAASRPGKEAR